MVCSTKIYSYSIKIICICLFKYKHFYEKRKFNIYTAVRSLRIKKKVSFLVHII